MGADRSWSHPSMPPPMEKWCSTRWHPGAFVECIPKQKQSISLISLQMLKADAMMVSSFVTWFCQPIETMWSYRFSSSANSCPAGSVGLKAHCWWAVLHMLIAPYSLLCSHRNVVPSDRWWNESPLSRRDLTMSLHFQQQLQEIRLENFYSRVLSAELIV